MTRIKVMFVSSFLFLSVIACERQIDKDLISAAADGKTAEVDLLLRQGANIEARAKDDWTALTIAAERGHLDTVRLLLEKGAKVNAKEGGGHTALFWAERNSYHDVAELLRKAGGRSE